MKLRRSKALQETVELNITAFLNLMVILVPFLLITAVFSRMTVLELNLPALNAASEAEAKVKLELQILIYPDLLEIRDANLGRIRQFKIADNKIDWPGVRDVLLEIKRRFPEETGVTLLLDSRVPYKRLIEVMDQVRSAEIVNVGTLEEVELFPSIAIGEAPPQGGTEETDVAVEALPHAEGEQP
jgi:biopolymer transport protein ExbD